MPDIEARTITGTRRGINTQTHNGDIQIVVFNSRGNVEGWNLILSPDNARQLAADLETLADMTSQDDDPVCVCGTHRSEHALSDCEQFEDATTRTVPYGYWTPPGYVHEQDAEPDPDYSVGYWPDDDIDAVSPTYPADPAELDQ